MDNIWLIWLISGQYVYNLYNFPFTKAVYWNNEKYFIPIKKKKIVYKRLDFDLII